MNDLDNICRVCLASDLRMFRIEDTGLLVNYELLTNTKLFKGDGKPEGICYLCRALLRKCNKFLAMAQNSEWVFMRFLGQGIEVKRNSITKLNLRVKPNYCISNVKPISITGYSKNQTTQVKTGIKQEIIEINRHTYAETVQISDILMDFEENFNNQHNVSGFEHPGEDDKKKYSSSDIKPIIDHNQDCIVLDAPNPTIIVEDKGHETQKGGSNHFPIVENKPKITVQKNESLNNKGIQNNQLIIKQEKINSENLQPLVTRQIDELDCSMKNISKTNSIELDRHEQISSEDIMPNTSTKRQVTIKKPATNKHHSANMISKGIEAATIQSTPVGALKAAIIQNIEKIRVHNNGNSDVQAPITTESLVHMESLGVPHINNQHNCSEKPLQATTTNDKSFKESDENFRKRKRRQRNGARNKNFISKELVHDLPEENCVNLRDSVTNIIQQNLLRQTSTKVEGQCDMSDDEVTNNKECIKRNSQLKWLKNYKSINQEQLTNVDPIDSDKFEYYEALANIDKSIKRELNNEKICPKHSAVENNGDNISCDFEAILDEGEDCIVLESPCPTIIVEDNDKIQKESSRYSPILKKIEPTNIVYENNFATNKVMLDDKIVIKQEKIDLEEISQPFTIEDELNDSMEKYFLLKNNVGLAQNKKQIISEEIIQDSLKEQKPGILDEQLLTDQERIESEYLKQLVTRKNGEFEFSSLGKDQLLKNETNNMELVRHNKKTCSEEIKEIPANEEQPCKSKKNNYSMIWPLNSIHIEQLGSDNQPHKSNEFVRPTASTEVNKIHYDQYSSDNSVQALKSEIISNIEKIRLHTNINEQATTTTMESKVDMEPFAVPVLYNKKLISSENLQSTSNNKISEGHAKNPRKRGRKGRRTRERNEKFTSNEFINDLLEEGDLGHLITNINQKNFGHTSPKEEGECDTSEDENNLVKQFQNNKSFNPELGEQLTVKQEKIDFNNMELKRKKEPISIKQTRKDNKSEKKLCTTSREVNKDPPKINNDQISPVNVQTATIIERIVQSKPLEVSVINNNQNNFKNSLQASTSLEELAKTSRKRKRPKNKLISKEFIHDSSDNNIEQNNLLRQNSTNEDRKYNKTSDDKESSPVTNIKSFVTIHKPVNVVENTKQMNPEHVTNADPKAKQSKNSKNIPVGPVPNEEIIYSDDVERYKAFNNLNSLENRVMIDEPIPPEPVMNAEPIDFDENEQYNAFNSLNSLEKRVRTNEPIRQEPVINAEPIVSDEDERYISVNNRDSSEQRVLSTEPIHSDLALSAQAIDSDDEEQLIVVETSLVEEFIHHSKPIQEDPVASRINEQVLMKDTYNSQYLPMKNDKYSSDESESEPTLVIDENLPSVSDNDNINKHSGNDPQKIASPKKRHLNSSVEQTESLFDPITSDEEEQVLSNENKSKDLLIRHKQGTDKLKRGRVDSYDRIESPKRHKSQNSENKYEDNEIELNNSVQSKIVHPTKGTQENYRHKKLDLKSYQCTKCDTKFAAHENLNDHLKFYHSRDKPGCGTSKRKNKSDTELKKHQERRRSSPAWSYSCDRCQKIFSRRSSLKIHTLFEHEPDDLK